MARKKKYVGNTYLPTDRSTTTSNSPPPTPSPIKGEGSRGAPPSRRRDLSLFRVK
jgi:hypothetical protein